MANCVNILAKNKMFIYLFILNLEQFQFEIQTHQYKIILNLCTLYKLRTFTDFYLEYNVIKTF